MKKIILSFLVLFLFFNLNVFAMVPETPDPTLDSTLPDSIPQIEQIKNLDILAEIKSDATVNVTETFDYDFGNQEKHGMYRIIPLNFTAKGEAGHTEIEVLGVVNELGDSYQYEVTSKDPLEIKIGSASELITGLHTYKISYTLKKSIGHYKDFDEWYWNLNGNAWEIPIQNISAEVILPTLVGKDNFKLKDYCGPKGVTLSCGTFIALDDQTVFYQTNSTINPSSGVTIAVGFPKNIVLTPTKMELFLYYLYSFWYLPLPILIVILLYFKRFSYWLRRRKFYKKNTIVAEYEAGEFSPAETAAIVLGKIEGEHLSANIINLAIKGYLIIKQNKQKIPEDQLEKIKLDAFSKKALGFINKTRILIVGGKEYFFERTKKDSSLLSENEKKLLEGVADKSESDLSKSFYVKAGKIVSGEFTSLSERGYLKLSLFKNTGTSFGKTSRGLCVVYFFLALNPGLFFWLALGTAYGFIFSGTLILVGLITLIFLPRRNRLTEKGFEAERKLLGLREYIDKAEDDRINFHNAPEKNPETFEKLLPYAMIFGLGKKWAKQFESIYITPPEWYRDSNMGAFSAVAFSSSMSHFSNAAGGAMISVPSSSGSRGGFSSGSSGSSGGGSSGGGGGGGGGGSW